MSLWRQIISAVVLCVLVAACSDSGITPDGTQTAVLPNTTTPTGFTPGTPTVQAIVPDEDPTLIARENMVQTGIIAAGIQSEPVIEALRTVPRHLFVPEQVRDQAYENHPLPIGYGQTISQPYIVALMTEAAEVSGDNVVLEIGTGSGYQAAVLAEIVDQVYSVEIIGDLALRAESNLQNAGYENVDILNDDGYFGWEEHAPYDAIIVTAAPDHVPQPLLLQLKIGGNMIIPVGPVGGVQTLWRIKRVSETDLQTANLGSVSFVPFIRQGIPE